jgi:hypothetical protein
MRRSISQQRLRSTTVMAMLGHAAAQLVTADFRGKRKIS